MDRAPCHVIALHITNTLNISRIELPALHEDEHICQKIWAKRTFDILSYFRCHVAPNFLSPK